jgi:hypothetical protein
MVLGLAAYQSGPSRRKPSDGRYDLEEEFVARYFRSRVARNVDLLACRSRAHWTSRKSYSVAFRSGQLMQLSWRQGWSL